LSLPRPLADYSAGKVPASATPTVWPDPVFAAERAISLWPADDANSCQLPVKPGSPAVAQRPSVEAQCASISPKLAAVVEQLISNRGWPGRGRVRWKVFYDDVVSECEARGMRSYSTRHISRAVKAIEAYRNPEEGFVNGEPR
jgi:hypothetical protein